MPSSAPVAHRPPDNPGPRRALVGIAVAATALLIAVYAFAVETRWGQRLDATAIKGRRVLSRHDIHVAARLHATIGVASVVLLGSAIVLVALVRGRPRLALGVGTVMAGSLATTEVMKRVLGHPNLGVVDALRHAPTFPSGHTTIAMALSVGAMFVAPRRFRTTVAVVGVVFAAAIGCSMVITASHRPSDPIGAALVVTAWSAAVAAVLLRTEPARHPGRPTWLRLSPWMALGGVMLLSAAFVSVVIVAIAIHYGRLDTVEIGRAFVAAAGAIVGTVMTCMAVLLLALHDTELDRPTTRTRPDVLD